VNPDLCRDLIAAAAAAAAADDDDDVNVNENDDVEIVCALLDQLLEPVLYNFLLFIFLIIVNYFHPCLIFEDSGVHYLISSWNQYYATFFNFTYMVLWATFTLV
jgi:hypothetical protein